MQLRSLITAACSFLIFVSTHAHALRNCVHNDKTRDLYAASNPLIHKVAVVNEEGRKTEEQYASEKGLPLHVVQNRFAATGRLKCGSIELTAQLTGSKGVITTAAHAFHDMATCKKKSDPTSCEFTTKINGREIKSRISELSAIGTKCPRIPNLYNDWAVLKIDPPMNDIEPYGLPENENFNEGDKLISVLSGSHDFVVTDPKTGKKVEPKTIDECAALKIERFGSPKVVASDCDSGQGGSGGSVLRREGNSDRLIAITVGNDENEDLLRSKSKNKRKFKPSDANGKNGWGTYHIPLNGVFLKAVQNAIGIQRI